MTDTKPPRRNSKAGRPREPISKDVLLLIASRRFAAQGYKAASLDDIAGAAGLSKQAVLHHFHGKEALYLAVMDHHVLALSGLVMGALTATGDFAARLDQLGDVMVDYFGSHRDAASLLLREALDRGPYFRRQGEALMGHVLSLSVHFMRAGLPQERWTEEQVRHMTLAIVSMHILYFSVQDTVTGLIGSEAYTAEGLASRKALLKADIRRLCGLDV